MSRTSRKLNYFFLIIKIVSVTEYLKILWGSPHILAAKINSKKFIGSKKIVFGYFFCSFNPSETALVELRSFLVIFLNALSNL